jgi:gliding motility-associated-like protein
MKYSKQTNQINSAEYKKPEQMLAIRNSFKKCLIVSTLLLNLLFLPNANASHIVGGDISYKHISGSNYEISLRIYRDVSGIDFDDTIYFFIYKEYIVNNGPDSLDLFTTTSVDISSAVQGELNPIIDPCVESPPDIEFEYIIYKDTVSLPNAPDLKSYHIASQRCCRNGALNNITDPDYTGIIWYSEICKEAINNTQSSPSFELFPEYYICVGSESEIDFSVNNSSAASIIHYYPYTPFAAGGQSPVCLNQYEAGDTCVVNNVDLIINEEMMPPYETVEWLNADVLNQFGPTSEFDVDLTTGIMTVNPSFTGLYLVGVEAVELNNNGDTLSIVRKEFEIKSVTCNKTFADFDVPNSFCGFTEISFENQSQLASNFTFYPDPDLLPNDSIATTNTSTPFIFDYPSPGVYNPMLIAYGNSCNDTVTYEIEIYTLDYFDNLVDSLLQDSFLICQEESIEMNPNLFPSNYPFEDNLEFLWTYNDTTSTEVNPTFVFNEDSEVLLLITDTSVDTCFFEYSFTINLLETDSLFNEYTICLGDSIDLLATYNNTTIVDVTWTPNTNISSVSDTLVTVYPSTNTTYTATLNYNYNYDESCPATTVIVYDINVETFGVEILGDTTFCYPNDDSLNLTFKVAPEDTEIMSILWEGNNMTYNTEEINVYPPENSITTYELTVTDTFGCVATDLIDILVPEEINIEIEGDSIYCFNNDEAAQLQAISDQAITSYSWSAEPPLPSGTDTSQDILIIQPNSPITTYTVIGTDSIGCTAEATFIVTIPEEPGIILDYEIFCDNNVVNVTLNASITGPGDYTLEWQNENGDFLSSDNPFTTILDESTTFYVLLTDEYGCTYGDSISVESPDPISVDITGTDFLCFNQLSPVELTANSDLAVSYFWPSLNLSTQAVTVNPSQTTSYEVIAFDQYGCTASDIFEVVVSDSIQINISGDSIHCLNDDQSIQLVASSDQSLTYSWSAEPPLPVGTTTNLNILTVDPTNPTTTYTVVGTDADGCSAEASFVVTIPEEPEIILDYEIFCDNNAVNVTLNASITGPGDYTLEWQNENGDFLSSDNPFTTILDESTTFYVLLTDEYGCTYGDSISVESPDPISVDITGTDFLCFNQLSTVELTANSDLAVSYFWPSLNLSTQAVTVNPSQTTSYEVIAFDQYGCTASDIFEVVVSDSIQINISGDSIHCLNDDQSIQLVASSDQSLTYSWSAEPPLPVGTTTNLNILTVDPTNPTTTYTVVGTDADGCSAETSIIVTIPDEPEIILDYEIFCDNNVVNVTLNASITGPGDYTLEWQNTNGDFLNSDNPFTTILDESTTFYILLTDEYGCTYGDSIFVESPDPISVDITGTDFLCFNQLSPVELTANSDLAVSYFWPSLNLSTQSITVNPSQTTSYEVIAYDQYNCTASDIFEVVVSDSIQINITGDSIHCLNDDQSIQLVASSDQSLTYSWSAEPPLPVGTTTNLNILTVDPTNPTTTYTVVGTDADGCSAETSIIVTIPDEPEIILDYEIFCDNNVVNVTLNASITGPGDYTLEWQNENGDSLSSDNPFTTILDESTTFYILLTDEYGCTYGDSISVESPDPIYVDITGIDFLCFNQLSTIELTANSDLAVSYFWPSLNLSTQSVTVNPSQTTSYEVIAFDQYGCTASDIFEVVVSDSIQINISGDSIHCLNDDQSIQLVASSDQSLTYSWSAEPPLPAGTTTNLNILTVDPTNPTTTYTVVGTDADGCSAETSIIVTIPDEPEIILDYEIFCEDSLVYVKLISEITGPGNYTIAWINENGDEIGTTATMTSVIEESQMFTILVTDEYGCIYDDSIYVEVPEININISTNSDIICIPGDGSVTLTANSNFDFINYEWYILNNPSLSDLIATGYTYTDDNIDATTTYLVIGTIENGCTATDTTTVVIPDTLINFNLSPDTLLCFNELDTINIQVTDAVPESIIYTWYDENGDEIPGIGNVDNYDFFISETTTIIIEGIDDYLCTHKDTITIQVTDPFELFVPTDTVCENTYFLDLIAYNESVDNTLPTASEITWVLNGNTVNTGNDTSYSFELPVGQQINNYTISYIDLDGCIVSASGIIYNYTLDLEDIYLGICPGDTVTINLPESEYNLDVVWNADLLETVIDSTDDYITILLDSIGQTVSFEPVFTNEHGCEDLISVTIETSDFETFPIQDTIVCYSDPIHFDYSINFNNHNYTYIWTSSNPNFNSLDTTPIFEPIVEPTTIYLEITDETNEVAVCTAYDTIEVNSHPPCAFSLLSTPNQGVLCEYPEEIQINIDSDHPLYNIEWTLEFTSNGDITIIDLDQFNDLETMLYEPIENGTYTFHVSGYSDPEGNDCPCEESITFDIYPLDVELNDILFCFDPESSVEICVENLDQLNTDIEIQWFGSDLTDPCLTVSPMNTTQYTANVMNDYGCQDDYTATVNVIDLYTDFELSANFTEIFYGADSVLDLTATLLNVNQVSSYYWNYDNEDLNFFDVSMLSASADQLTETTEFTLTLFSEDSLCIDSQSIIIELIESVCDTPNIFVPTAFSPNGDGLNDQLYVKGNLIEYMDFYIVNRWGQTVFESNNPNIGWNGTFLQEDLPPDVYGFSLTAYCEDDDVFTLKGNINLIR